MSLVEDLIHEIRAGGTQEVHALAARLGTSPKMVKAMLEHLERRGALLDMAGSPASACQTSSACQACSLAGECGSGGGSAKHLWVWRNPPCRPEPS
jgi:hypothetical protein